MGNVYLTPEEQAEIMLENYIRSVQTYIDGREKRKLKREMIRKARRGKYKNIFGDPNITLEESRKHFSELN
jgi:hypothetical protein